MAAGDMAELEARYGPKIPWLVAAAGVTGTISMVLSATIVNVAVPMQWGHLELPKIRRNGWQLLS